MNIIVKWEQLFETQYFFHRLFELTIESIE